MSDIYEIPDWVEEIPRPGKSTKYIDTRTGKRTYPSWWVRQDIEEFLLEDFDMRSIPVTRDLELIHRRVMHQFHINGTNGDDRIKTAEVLSALKASESVAAKPARRILEQLWCSGLVKRFGLLHMRSGRPYRQTWQF